jgi:hypothetical protein
MEDKEKLFQFSIDRIKATSHELGLALPQAFGVWFANMYFGKPIDLHIPDGAGDGKIDIFFKTEKDGGFQYHILNSKFTKKYAQTAPVHFYDEITRFWQAFANVPNRKHYLETVRPELVGKYRELFARYDEKKATLMFITNLRKNDKQYNTIKKYGVRVFHLDDVLEFLIDHIEGAMPHTPTMALTDISGVLSPDIRDTEVPTSIIFARLLDIIEYMKKDPYDLLFARNIRLWLKNTPVNKDIQETFKKYPKEFAFSNNGITMLCTTHNYHPGRKELTIENPRIVNGSQTLHSVRNILNPSKNARVMLKIIQVPPTDGNELTKANKKRRDIINKISIRTNRQNPIKRWDLVSNDPFQNELARYFRQKKLFYERRQKEWSVRSSELRSIGIQRGPNIKELIQFIASYHFQHKTLGPAIAKQSVGELFEQKSYDVIISETTPELAYSIYLLSKIVDKSFKRLAEKYRYVGNYSGHIRFVLFSLISKLLKTKMAGWSSSQIITFLEGYATSYNKTKDWESLIKILIKHIDKLYKQQDKRYKNKTGTGLTLNNYFKSGGYMKEIIESRFPQQIKKLTKKILCYK